MGTLSLIRGTEWFSKTRKLKIVIDGSKAGKIGFNITKDFELADGQHELYVKIYWIKNHTVHFDRQADSVTVFKIRFPADSENPLGVLLATLLDRKNVIALQDPSLATKEQ